MKPQFRVWPITWLFIALLLATFSFAGGDISIETGLLFLVWTAPFGIVWTFIFYDYVLMLNWLPKPMVDIGGVLLSVAVAYIFWFVLMPRIRRAAKKGRS